MQNSAHVKPRTSGLAERVAEETLMEHGIMQIPVNPVEIAEMVGIEVYYANFGNPNVSGLIRKDGNKVIIYVKHTDNPMRQRFTVAHELGHFFMHLDAPEGHFVDMYRTVNFSDDDNPLEKEANQFAAALLMPRHYVQQEQKYADSLEDLAFSFRVSVQAMSLRLRDLGDL